MKTRAICWGLSLALCLACFFEHPSLAQANHKVIVCPQGCDYKTIQAAIDAAQHNDTIHLAPGTYIEHLTLYDKQISLVGEDAATTIVSGNNEGRVLSLYANSALTMTNITIRNGKVTDNQGGGIYNDGLLVIDKSRIVNNSASVSGGGIANFGTLRISRSTIAGNTSPGNGAGIVNGGRMTITASTFFGNYAKGRGGAIYHSVGTFVLTASSVTNNRADFAGGGIANFDRMIITGSTVSANKTAGAGGGVLNGGQMTLMNLTMTSNRASDGDSYYNGGTLVMGSTKLVGGDSSVNCTNWGVVFLVKPNLHGAADCGSTSPGN
jgi:predicted outer membrane repeat protein